MDAVDKINARLRELNHQFQISHAEIDQGFIKDDFPDRTKFWRTTRSIGDGQLLTVFNAYNSEDPTRIFSEAVITPKDQRALKKLEKDNNIRRASEHLQAQSNVLEMIDSWRENNVFYLTNHYLKSKKLERFTDSPQCFLRGSNNSNEPVLVIPMLDDEGEVWNCQQIWAGGEKRFWAGGRTEGLAATFEGHTDYRFIAEGFATAASVYLATGRTTICAFSKANLKHVMKNLLGKIHTSKIRVVVDWDGKTFEEKGTNVGLKESLRIVKKYKCSLVLPFLETEKAKYAGRNFDASDLYLEEGLEKLTKCMSTPIHWSEL